MSLEDGTADVIAKAMQGLGISATALSETSGLTPARIGAALNGDPGPATLRAIAPALGLDPEALAALPGYLPGKQEIPGVRRIGLPFGQWTVNAWLVSHAGTSLLFDTGCSGHDITTGLRGEVPETVLITHAHPDHIGGVSALEATGARIISEAGALETSAFAFGEISLRATDLSGHKTPSAGYLIEGLEKKLLVAGDAIFAGSIGRCRSAADYQTALENLRRVLREAGPDCVILPGHGPATTVSEELASNPFHPRFA